MCGMSAKIGSSQGTARCQHVEGKRERTAQSSMMSSTNIIMRYRSCSTGIRPIVVHCEMTF